MQKVLLIGNLGRDPEVKYSQQGTALEALIPHRPSTRQNRREYRDSTGMVLAQPDRSDYAFVAGALGVGFTSALNRG